MKLRDLLNEIEMNEGLLDKAKGALGMKTDAQKAEEACESKFARNIKREWNTISNGTTGGLTMVYNEAKKAGCDALAAKVLKRINELKKQEEYESSDQGKNDKKQKMIDAYKKSSKTYADLEAKIGNPRALEMNPAAEKALGDLQYQKKMLKRDFGMSDSEIEALTK